MILLISLCLAGGVWLPLCIGRVLAAVSLAELLPSERLTDLGYPQAHAHSLVTMPLRAVRTISDPLFDALFSLVAAIPKFLLRQAAPRLAPVCAALASPFAQACTKAFGPVSVSLAANATEPVVALNSTLAGNGAAGLTEVARPAAVTLLKKTLDAIAYHWTHMATDDDPLHRGLCIALGYGAALLAGVWYLQFTQSESAQQVNRMIREGITQQLVLLKVCLFIFIEVSRVAAFDGSLADVSFREQIILFPGTCGALLNLATLPLFPQATIAGRLAFHVRAPISGASLVVHGALRFTHLLNPQPSSSAGSRARPSCSPSPRPSTWSASSCGLASSGSFAILKLPSFTPSGRFSSAPRALRCARSPPAPCCTAP